MTKRYDIELRGNTKNHRAEFGKSIKTNEAFAHSMKGVAQGAAAIDGPLGGVASRVSVMNSLFRSGNIILAGFGAGLAALSFTAVKSLKVFNEYEQQQLRTEALVRATGAAAGFTAEQLSKQADEVALNTLASVGGIVEAQNVLLTFKSVSGEAFKQSIRLAQDMAATFGGSAKDKALQLGKALEDPTTGLNALRRSGVSFTESEKDMIKAMQEAGDLAGAQTIILKKLEQQVGGAGSAEAGGLAGSVDTLGQRWDELMLSFSKTSGLGEGVTNIINRIANGINKVTQAINGTTDRAERLTELFNEYTEIQEKIDKLAAAGKGAAWLEPKKKAILEEIELLNKKTIAEGEAHRQSALNQLKIEEELKAEKNKLAQEEADKKAAKQAAEDAKQKEINDREIQRLRNKHSQVHEALLGAEEKEKELATARYERKKEELEKEFELLKTKGIVTEELTREQNAALENLKAEHELNLAAIRKEANDKEAAEEKEKQKILMDGYSNLLDVVGSYFDGMQGKKAGAVRVAISLGQTLLDEEKRNSVVSIWTNTYEAAMKAYNSLAAIPFIGPALGAGAAGAMIGVGGLYAAKVSGLASFDGGGFTGNIPRYGGVDGKGGFPAILHGYETVIDHTKGQSLGSTQNMITSNHNYYGVSAREQRKIRDNNRQQDFHDARRVGRFINRPA